MTLCFKEGKEHSTYSKYDIAEEMFNLGYVNPNEYLEEESAKQILEAKALIKEFLQRLVKAGK